MLNNLNPKIFPFIVATIFILCLLIIAFIYNFIPATEFKRAILDPSLRYNLNFERLENKIVVNNQTTIDLNSEDQYIELNGDCIYTLKLNEIEKCKKLEVYNNSNFVVNIKLSNKFITVKPLDTIKLR